LKDTGCDRRCRYDVPIAWERWYWIVSQFQIRGVKMRGQDRIGRVYSLW